MPNGISLKEHMRQYAVEAESVEDFLDKYYKPDRFRGRGEEYAAALIKSHERDLEEYGFDLITYHDSVTGRDVTFYGPIKKAEEST